MCPQWNTTERGKTQEDQFTTSYGDGSTDGDYDGKSCADFHQLPGRGIRDVEDLTMLSGLAHFGEPSAPDSTDSQGSSDYDYDEES